MKIEKLLKQKKALEEKIKSAESVARNKTRVEKMLARLVGKHEILFTADPTQVEKLVEEALAKIAAEMQKGS